MYQLLRQLRPPRAVLACRRSCRAPSICVRVTWAACFLAYVWQHCSTVTAAHEAVAPAAQLTRGLQTAWAE